MENSNIIYEQRGNNTIYYLYDLTGLVGLKYNNNTYYYIKNIQGDIIGILDQDYNEIVTYEYDSWGKLLSIKDNQDNEIIDETNIGIINPFRYREYYYDTETGLYYLNSRYYNPTWERFLNHDSILKQDLSLLGNNMYLYTSNNPTNRRDFSGTSWKSFWNGVRKSIQNFAVDAGIAVTGAIAYILGKKQTARTMWNSLGNKPKNLTNKDLSGVIDQIKSSSEFKKTINNIVKNNPNNTINETQGITFSAGSFEDLGLSLHGVTINVKGTTTNGKGILNITITDTYDFKYERLDKNPSLGDRVLNYWNNLGYFHQTSGFINPYDIIIQFDYEIE